MRAAFHIVSVALVAISNWPDFAKRMKEFAQKTAQAAKISHTQGPDAALTTMLDVLTCKVCHEKSREEKK